VVAPHYVSVVDAHDLNVEWRAVTASSWVHLSPDHGRTPTEVRVTVSTRGLAPGTHRAGVAISMEDGGENATGASFIVELTLDAPGWRALDGPYGAWVTSLAVNPENTNIIVAGVVDGDLLVSADNGASFTHHDLNSDDPFSAVAFADGNRAYAGAKGVYRSDDGGLTWGLAGLANRHVYWLAVDPTDVDRLLIEGDGVWRSVDGGANWEQVTIPGGSWCVTGDPTRPGTFVIGSDLGTVYTTSATAGSGAIAVTNTGYENEIVSIAVLASGRWVAVHDVDSSHSPALRVSDDAGASWSNPGAAGFADEEQSVLMWLAAVGDELYGLHKELYRSRDGGETFEGLSTGIHEYRGGERRYYAAVAHPDGLLLAHNSLGIIRYADGGSQQLPIYDFRINGIEVDPTSGDIFGIMSPGGVFTRSGSSFRSISGAGMWAEYPNDISLDPRSPASIAVSGEDNEVMVTTDGGATWVRGGAGLAIEDGRRISRAPDDPEVIWAAGTGDGLFRTGDNGATWTELDGWTVYHVAAISATEALYHAGGEIRIADSATPSVAMLHTRSASPSMLRRTEDGSHWFGSSGGLERSTDNGQTFENLGLAEGTFYDVLTMPGDPSHVFVATNSGLLGSRNGGGTWENINCPFTVYSLAHDPSANLIVAGTFSGGVYTYSP